MISEYIESAQHATASERRAIVKALVIELCTNDPCMFCGGFAIDSVDVADFLELDCIRSCPPCCHIVLLHRDLNRLLWELL